jgi:hypothetical protein
LRDYLPLEEEDLAFQGTQSEYPRRDGRESDYGWRGGWCDEESDDEEDEYWYGDEDYGYDYDGDSDEEEFDDPNLDDKNPRGKSEGKNGNKAEDWAGYVDLEDLDRQDDEENEDMEGVGKHGNERDGNRENRRVDRRGPAGGTEQVPPGMDRENGNSKDNRVDRTRPAGGAEQASPANNKNPFLGGGEEVEEAEEGER